MAPALGGDPKQTCEPPKPPSDPASSILSIITGGETVDFFLDIEPISQGAPTDPSAPNVGVDSGYTDEAT